LPKPQKEPLRMLSEQERQELQQIVHATSERMDVIKRARALLAVAKGQSFRAAASEAGFASSDTICHLVARFNRQGLLALLIAAGRGRKPTYSHQDRQKIVETFKSEPVRKVDASATWSLSLLEQKLRETGLPKVGASTIGRTLHQAGYAYGQSRTWCQTGTVLRKRKEGVVHVQDPKTEEKKA
jgi:transposase